VRGLISIALLAVACSGGESGGSGNAGSSGSSGSSGSGGSPGSGGSASGPFEVVTIKTTPKSIGPGEETVFCQNFANPFGRDVEIIESVSMMTAGSHHMFVFYQDSGATNGPLEECSGLEFGRWMHVAQRPEQVNAYPPGVGRLVGSQVGLRVLAHYFNPRQDAIDAEISVQFKVVPAGTVEHQAGALFFDNHDIWVDRQSTGTATKTCAIRDDIKLISAVSHMHRHGTHFIATASSGQTIFETDQWDEPELTNFAPPLELAAGSEVTFTCSYDNREDVPLGWGESAKTDEMCILAGGYYPAPAGAPILCF
jgi:hypothetical protein